MNDLGIYILLTAVVLAIGATNVATLMSSRPRTNPDIAKLAAEIKALREHLTSRESGRRQGLLQELVGLNADLTEVHKNLRNGNRENSTNSRGHV